MDVSTTSIQTIIPVPGPARGPAVWLGADQKPGDWIVQLDHTDCTELVHAAEALHGRTLDDLRREDFHIPGMAPKLSYTANRLGDGAGFILLRGLPAADLPQELVETIFWGIGTHMGVGVSQSTAGDRLGHVIDRGTSETERYYTRGGPIEFHMDPIDAVGLLCLRAALSGGASRIVSAGAIHNLILAERPGLLQVLYRGFHNSRRGHGLSTPSSADDDPAGRHRGSSALCHRERGSRICRSSRKPSRRLPRYGFPRRRHTISQQPHHPAFTH